MLGEICFGENFEFCEFLYFLAFLSSSLPFCLVCRFSYHLLPLLFFLLLDDILEFFFGF
jgi:hypothetical protein